MLWQKGLLITVWITFNNNFQLTLWIISSTFFWWASKIIVHIEVSLNVIEFDNNLADVNKFTFSTTILKKFCSYCKFRRFLIFHNHVANYRNFHSYQQIRHFPNLWWAFPATLWINFIDFVSGMANYRKFRSFRKFRNFRNFCNFWWVFPATLWIHFVDIVSGLANYRKFCSFCKFHNSRNFRWAFPATLWINYVDSVSGMANYHKLRIILNFAVFVKFVIFVTFDGPSLQPLE